MSDDNRPERGLLLEQGTAWWPEAGPDARCRVCGLVAADDPDGTYQWRWPDGSVTCGPCMPPAVGAPYRVTACCPDCGRTSIDDDGCCDVCGRDTDAHGEDTDRVAAALDRTDVIGRIRRAQDAFVAWAAASAAVATAASDLAAVLCQAQGERGTVESEMEVEHGDR